jgi:hypothetical protein
MMSISCHVISIYCIDRKITSVSRGMKTVLMVLDRNASEPLVPELGHFEVKTVIES